MGADSMLDELDLQHEASELGAKAERLRWLAARGARTPVTFVVTATATDRLASSDPAALALLARDLEDRLAPGTSYAVRSSAGIEDGAHRSLAGRFLTVLDVRGVDALVEAVRQVVASLEGTDGAKAVIVQEMVLPRLSGVAFSRNPLTGLSDVVVEAIEGRGDALLQDGSDPIRWVDRWGTLVDRPADSEFDGVVAEVVAETRRLAQAFGSPLDLEWVWDGGKVWWVQARPITGLENLPLYSRRIAKEVLPGMIKPLVWSINVPMVNKAWIRLFTEAIGPNRLDPDQLARSIGYRAYFDMRAIGDIFELLGMPRDSLEGLLGLPGAQRPTVRPSAAVVRRMPRMAAALLGKVRYRSRLHRELPALMSAFRAYAGRDLPSLTDAELVRSVDRLVELGSRAAYHNILNPLLANLTRSLLDRRMAAKDLDLHAVDLGVGEDDGSPGPDLRRLAAVLEGEGLGAEASTPPADLPGSVEAELRRVLDKHGHLSENANDLSVPRWREDPSLVLRLARSFPPASASGTPWVEATGGLPVGGRLFLGFFRKRTVEYERRRNQVSSAYTFGYGTLRPYFLEIGARLAERGALEEPEDVMYLAYDEIKTALTGLDLRQLVADRKADMDRYAYVEVPEIVYGDDWLPVPAHSGRHLRGTGTARGQYRGPAVAVRTLTEGDRLRPGDVLVVPHSDVAWTPLFARAGAVVAESGGMLAHSSIVARETGIPAVVSVPDACRLLDGKQVLVDGYTGDVYIEEAGPQ